MADPIEHLAVLAEQAGKLRTAEWLRTCALLPPEQWPPAPAYKGPMVPAADFRRLERQVERLPWRQRDYDRARLELRKLNDAMLRKNRLLAKRTAERDLAVAHDRQPYPTAHAYEQVCRVLRERTTQRDALQARIDEIRAVLGEDAATRARFQVDVSTSYGPRFLSRIRAIVEHAGDQPEVTGG